MNILCEALIPLLALCVLILVFGRSPYRVRLLGAVLISLGWVYLLTWLDRRAGWWASRGLDFSTHVSVAGTLAFAIALRGGGYRVLATALLLTYAYCLVHLGYHSLADLATTLLVVLPFAIAAHAFLHEKREEERDAGGDR